MRIGLRIEFYVRHKPLEQVFGINHSGSNSFAERGLWPAVNVRTPWLSGPGCPLRFDPNQETLPLEPLTGADRRRGRFWLRENRETAKNSV